MAEYQLVNGTPTLKKEYGYRNGQLLVIAEATGACQWLVPDALGTPRLLVDQTGSLNGVKRRDYLPFGEELQAGIGHRQASDGYGGAQGTRQQFTGKERDDETRLDYFEARYYSNVQGRFTSPDEFTGGPDELYDFADLASDNPTFYADIHDPQSLNKYQYCYNDPLATVDPNGHKGWRELAKQAVAVAADFGDGVIRGVASSLSYGTAPGSEPSESDSGVNRVGQVIGTAIVGGTGTSSIGAGVTVTVGTGGLGAVVGAPVIAGGAVMVGGAVKNVGALITTPMQMSSTSKHGTYAPDRELPRDPKTGKPVPESQSPHTQLGTRNSRTRPGEKYTQGREFGEGGKHVKDVDFTNHGRKDHTNPHQHRVDPKTGKRGKQEPLEE